MDTIEIGIQLKNGLYLNDDINWIREYINNMKSPYGYEFCNFLEVTCQNRVMIKISYPRYFNGTNAYLVNSISKCLEVQRYFVDYLYRTCTDYLGAIRLSRVDIPFTYYMEDNEEFRNFEFIYRIFAYVYNEKKTGTRPKGYIDVLSMELETIVYSDNGATGKSANNKLMIYNQYLNLANKISSSDFNRVCYDYPDLSKRIRMEVSKRIRIKDFSAREFMTRNILDTYFEEYKKYILENVLDMRIIDSLYETWSEELATKLRCFRSLRNFNYEIFVLQQIGNIYDYEVLRRALKLVIENEKTREGAVTKIRKILNNYEERENVKVLDVYKTIIKMRNAILNSSITY